MALGGKPEAEARSERRLEIAISLLRGKVVLRERDGYDPGGFRRNEITRTCEGALDMADELMRLNTNYGKTQEELFNEPTE